MKKFLLTFMFEYNGPDWSDMFPMNTVEEGETLESVWEIEKRRMIANGWVQSESGKFVNEDFTCDILIMEVNDHDYAVLNKYI